MNLAELFAEPVLALADLDVDPWQYVALGHIHRRQTMGERCAYMGSPDRLDFSDEGVEKAFSEFHLPDDGSIGTNIAVQANARRFVTMSLSDDVDLANIACAGHLWRAVRHRHRPLPLQRDRQRGPHALILEIERRPAAGPTTCTPVSHLEAPRAAPDCVPKHSKQAHR
jgi:DNA repair exonuclease SbcCD nuclease subunit